MTDKIVEMPNIERENLIAKIEEMKRILPHVLEFSKLNAQIKWSQYNSYIAQGFTKCQALYLISGK